MVKEFQLRYEFEKTVKVVRKEMGTVGEIESVRYHCGRWPEEVNTCFLNSFMVYL